MEKLRKDYEIHIKDLKNRLTLAEDNANKTNKRIIHKIEQRVQELETHLESEQRHHQETLKEIRRNERKFKELQIKIDDDCKSQSKLLDLVDTLQSKLKVYIYIFISKI